MEKTDEPKVFDFSTQAVSKPLFCNITLYTGLTKRNVPSAKESARGPAGAAGAQG